MISSSFSPHWTPEEIARACAGELHPSAQRGIQYFNAGDYFNAHEELEVAWRDERGPARDVYRAVLQVGLGYYQIQRGNFRGAAKMFRRARPWLEPFPGVCQGIDLDQLRKDLLAAEEELHRLGPDRLAYFDPSLFRPVKDKE